MSSRQRLTHANWHARASAESATRASKVLVAEMTAEAAKPRDIAKWADAAIVEILCDEATPHVDDLESDAIALVAKIVGLQTAHNAARDINERRRPRALTVEERALRDMGRGAAIRHSELEDDGAPPEALAVVGAFSERLRPAIWARVGEAIIQALQGRDEAIESSVTELVGAWRRFESDIREDSGAHFAGGK